MDKFNYEIDGQKNIELNAINAENEIIEMEKIVGIENELEKSYFDYLVLDPKCQKMPNYDLGIEVTIPKFAEGKENIDPQHGAEVNLESSAIEEALVYDISKLEKDAKLATIRPDADSIGAMAVLELRQSGLKIDKNLVKAIGRGDSLGLKRAKEMHPEVEIRQKEITAAASQCLGKSTIKEKVTFMKKLLTNSIEYSEIEKMWNEHQIKRKSAREKLTVSTILENQAVLVSGNHPMAFEIGYENAGIVAAFNPTFLRPWIENDKENEKWTIARYSEKEPIDIKGLSAKLNELEKEYGGTGLWGGPANLIASPQGESSKIPFEKIIETIKKFIIVEF